MSDDAFTPTTDLELSRMYELALEDQAEAIAAVASIRRELSARSKAVGTCPIAECVIREGHRDDHMDSEGNRMPLLPGVENGKGVTESGTFRPIVTLCPSDKENNNVNQ